ncbi:MAG: hypothetical protein ACJAS1_006240 [Oleiphilaceae bacterium]|jgi:hypothetical protein
MAPVIDIFKEGEGHLRWITPEKVKYLIDHLPFDQKASGVSLNIETFALLDTHLERVRQLEDDADAAALRSLSTRAQRISLLEDSFDTNQTHQ